MFNSPEFMREMKRGEEDAVDDLLVAAFEGAAEAQLVHALRKSKAIAGEMVLPMQGEVIGYAALSTMIAPKGWLALAPVAIAPAHSGRGFGKRLVGMIAQWAQMSGQTVVVLGDPALYESCGCTPLSRAFTAHYPLDHLLTVGPTQAKQKELIYPKAFGA